MTDQFLAEIRMVGFNFPPTGWTTCDGQLLPISQNTALFSLLGTNFGGNGKTTFGLPNLDGSFAMDWGDGKGLSQRFIGETGGEDSVTLLQSEMPFHTHSINALDAVGTTPVPTGAVLARYPGLYQDNTSQNLNAMAFQSLGITGNSLPHNNLMPFLTVNYVIAMQGIFPARG